MTPVAYPTTVSEALRFAIQEGYTPLAGGTDFFPSRHGRARADSVVDISKIEKLSQICAVGTNVEIGASVTWSDLLRADLPPAFDGLKLAAREIGGPQIQNRGTLVGNICNASPAADGVPALLALNALVRWHDATGEHATPLAQFIIGARKTILPRSALVVGLSIPNMTPHLRSTFLKTGARTYLLISTVMCAATIEVDDATVVDARVAIGAASAVAQRLPTLEAALRGARVSETLGDLVTARHCSALTPIDDVRSDAAYRIDAAVTLARRALNALGLTQ